LPIVQDTGRGLRIARRNAPVSVADVVKPTAFPIGRGLLTRRMVDLVVSLTERNGPDRPAGSKQGLSQLIGVSH
jgi:hypothetical protein